MAVFQALIYLLIVLTIRNIGRQMLFSRLSFYRGTETETASLKSFFFERILTLYHAEFKPREEFIWVFVLACQITALALLPISGEPLIDFKHGEYLFVMFLLFAAGVQIFGVWFSHHQDEWRTSLNILLFTIVLAVICFGITEGLLVSLKITRFEELINHQFLLTYSPFHFLAFMVLLLIIPSVHTFYTQVPALRGLSHLVPSISEIVWMTFILLIFWNEGFHAGPVFYFVLAFKCSGILILSDLVRAISPRVRVDQVENLVIRVVLPATFVSLLGLWGRMLL